MVEYRVGTVGLSAVRVWWRSEVPGKVMSCEVSVK